MRIQQLKLENYRGFGKLIIDFPEKGSTIFIGGNGSGKSSVLEAVVVAGNTFFAKKINDLPEYVQLQQSDIRINASFAEVFMKIMVNGKKESVKISANRLDWGQFKLANDPKVEYNNDEDSAFFDHLPLLVYYPTNRMVDDYPVLEIPSQEEFYPVYALKNAFNSTLNYDAFFRWFRGREDIENEKRLRENSAYRDRDLDAARNAIGKFFEVLGYGKPFVKRSPKEEFVLEKQGEKGGMLYSITQLSHGEKVLIATFGDIARRLALSNPTSDNPLQEDGIVLIDEIELHLHPSWQRKIVPALETTFPNVQFIMTTHSPQVISGMEREQVFVLKEFKILQETPYTKGRDSNSILYDLFEVEKRPKEEAQEIKKLYDYIDKEDVENAQKQLELLRLKLGGGDVEIQRAETYLSLLID